MPTNKKMFSTYLTDEETAKLRDLAAASGLSCSKVIRNLIAGGAVLSARTPENWKKNHALSELRRINADQARLGNLLKRALNAGPDIQAEQEIRQAMAAVSRTRAEIRSALLACKESLARDC